MQLLSPARRIQIRRVFIFLAIACVTGAVMAQSRGDPARGEAKAAPCATCHGGAERPPLPATPWLDGQLGEVTELQLVLIREGLREVPQMAGLLDKLTDPDLMDIGAYYARRTPPRPNGQADAKLRARGAELARSMGC